MSARREEIKAKLDAAYMATIRFEDRPALRPTCHCNAFAFTHLETDECPPPPGWRKTVLLEAA